MEPPDPLTPKGSAPAIHSTSATALRSYYGMDRQVPEPVGLKLKTRATLRLLFSAIVWLENSPEGGLVSVIGGGAAFAYGALGNSVISFGLGTFLLFPWGLRLVIGTARKIGEAVSDVIGSIRQMVRDEAEIIQIEDLEKKGGEDYLKRRRLERYDER